MSTDARSVVLKDQDTLAGSCTSLLQTFRNMVRVLRVPIGKASAMLSETPARYATVSGLEVKVAKDICDVTMGSAAQAAEYA